MQEPKQWWRDAVIYQLYIRSFADSDGDGIGDIDGIRSRLDYLAALGVDAIWITPWYPSPQADGGYDVADYRGIAPELGDLDAARALIDESHAVGIRVVLDIVPNHASSEHPWFVQALREGPSSPMRRRFHFDEGHGPHSEEPPNDWQSQFGGSAWDRLPSGEWYLHQFDARQPDLNWENEDVREDFRQTLRFWFDMGVDGFRIDVATALIKAPGLPDLGFVEDAFLAEVRMDDHPYRDREGVHDIYREWRQVANLYDPQRVLIAEAWLERPERLSRYLRPDELHMAFNVPFLGAAWTADALRDAIVSELQTVDPVDATASWVLENHDSERIVTRYGRSDTRKRRGVDAETLGSSDESLGQQRARAAAVLMLSLPGCVFLYQGEELGLPNAPIPDEAIQDPIWSRSGHTRRGRDGVRVPLPWQENPAHSFGFGAGEPWLPQPAWWGDFSVQAQTDDPASMLELHRRLMRHRKELELGPIESIETCHGGLMVRRTCADGKFAALINPSGTPVHFSLSALGGLESLEVLVSSDSAAVTVTAQSVILGSNTAAWVLLAPSAAN